jgi:hypothetical protein
MNDGSCDPHFHALVDKAVANALAKSSLVQGLPPLVPRNDSMHGSNEQPTS